MKRKTTKHRRSARQNVLQVRVMSPRIAWFGFLRLTGKLCKIAAVLAVIAGTGWGVWRGIRHTFYQNPDFRLQVIDLNRNPAIDELGVATAAGIDLTKNPSLFDIDVSDATARLKALPAIADARLERHLPGTLVARVTPRSAKAWLTATGTACNRRPGDWIVDAQGFAYPCPPRLAESTAALPIIELSPSADHPLDKPGKISHPELDPCFLLLDSACEADPEASQWIQAIRQANAWSLLLVTREGTQATFSLGDHARQIESLRAALDHAGEKGYVIDTINLIPKYNIPVTLRSEAPAPRAVPVPAAEDPASPPNRRARDLRNLLNRN